jgi:hypothetical protein
MAPRNKPKKQEKVKTAAKPLANTGALDSNTTTTSLPNNIPSPAPAAHIAFREFIAIAKLGNIKDFLKTAASTSDGENLKLLWARTFKEGLRVGHELYVGAVAKLNEAHNEGYEEGYNEGRRDEQGDWIMDGYGLQGEQPPVCEESGTQTEPPSLVDSSTSTSDTDTAVNEPTPTPINPPPPVPTVTVDRSTQTQDDDDDSPPLPPVPSTAPVRDPPPKTVPHPPSSAARLNWADDAATSLPILPSNPPLRDLSVLRSSFPRPFLSLQRRNKNPKKYFFRPFKNYNMSSVCRQNNFHARSLPLYALSAPFVQKPRQSPSPSTLNWEDDPRLSDLSRALKALGWIRPPAVRAPPW